MKLMLLTLITSLLMSMNFSSCGKDSDQDEPENPSEQPTTGKKEMTAYFPFNGNFEDYSGNEIYGYGSPEPTFGNGLSSGTKALYFSKKDKSAFIVGKGLIDTRSMTICFWLKNISEGNIFYVTSANKSDGGEVMMSFTYRDGHLKYVVSRYCNYYSFGDTGNFKHKAIDDGEWHHIALVTDYNNLKWGASTSKLYIDGKIMDTVTEDINPFSEAESSNKHYGTGTKFIIGGSNVPNMQIANLRIYNNCQLDEKDIKKIYDKKE